ncbi:hypothetical protein [Egbenema bharatensis]|uniref:hypothetical protein n=1 Tax=Egbenema bharatensis TaxID=3463334 RepID=UPI003A85A381
MTQQLSCINLRIKNWRSIFLGLLTFLFVIIISNACTPNINSRANLDAECHIVQHARGETCVPNNPQRIVVLGGLDDALSLGVRPIGSDNLGIQEIHLRDKLEGIEDVGGNNAPSIEKILVTQTGSDLGR